MSSADRLAEWMRKPVIGDQFSGFVTMGEVLIAAGSVAGLVLFVIAA